MGIWGMGIFDNDSALDFLDEVVNHFARRTSTALGLEIRGDDLIEVKSLAQIEIADIDHIVLPSVAILVRLCGASDSRRVQSTFGAQHLLLRTLFEPGASKRWRRSQRMCTTT